MPGRIFYTSQYRIPVLMVLDRPGDEPLLEFYNNRTKKRGSVPLSDFVSSLIKFCSAAD